MLAGKGIMSIIESRHYHYQVISEGVFAAIAREGGGAFANSGIVDLGDQTLIFDTAMTPTAAYDLLNAAKTLTGRTHVDFVVNSHYHRDHVRGNMVFPPETLILANRETRNLLNSKGRVQLKTDVEQIPGRLHELDREYVRSYHHLSIAEQGDLQRMIGWHRATLDNLSRLRVRLPDVTFDRRMVVNGSRHRAVLIALDHAHTASDTLLYLPDLAIAFVGDLVSDAHHFWLGELAVDALEDALAFIETLSLRAIVPGHGTVLDHVPTATIIAYQRRLFALVQAAIDSALPKADLLATPCPPEFATWPMKLVLYELNLGALYGDRDPFGDNRESIAPNDPTLLEESEQEESDDQ